MKKHYIAPLLEVMDTTGEEQLLTGSIVGNAVATDESGYTDETALTPMFGWDFESME